VGVRRRRAPAAGRKVDNRQSIVKRLIMPRVMKRILEHVIPPKLGYALVVTRGQHLRIIDLEGKQVVDMALFNAANPREKLSTSNSRTRYIPKPGAEYVPRDKLTEGDTLMSTLCRPMMTFVKETPEPKGVHDTHNRMCNRYLYESYGFGPRDGCHENISRTSSSGSRTVRSTCSMPATAITARR
jgi:uncharacterized protein